MSNNKPIRHVAIIGTGVIGASWTALFLAKGLDVIATDIAPDAEVSLRRFVKAAWPALGDWVLRPAHRNRNSHSRQICRQQFGPRTSSRKTGPNGSTSNRNSMASLTNCCRPR